MVTLTTGVMFLLLTCMHFCVWATLRKWSTYAPTAYEVVRDCRNTALHKLKISRTSFRALFAQNIRDGEILSFRRYA
jgi:hypothetical protein